MTTSEFNGNMQKRNKKKRLMVMHKTNKALTPEQKSLIEEDIRRTQQAKISYQQTQEDRKGKRRGIEM